MQVAAGSNLPSCGSIHPQAIGTSTVFNPICASCGQTGFMYSGLEAAVFINSPAKARYGLPSTINWVAAPRFSKWAMDGSEAAAAGWNWAVIAAKPQAAVNRQNV